MWGTSKIVNFSLLLFSTLVIGQNLLTQKNTLSKWSVNAFYCVNGLHVGLRILCVKMRTFLCEESTVAASQKINCHPPYPDHYLKAKFQTSFQRFNAGKLGELLQLIQVTQHALRPHNLIFLLSFVLLLSPKQ